LKSNFFYVIGCNGTIQKTTAALAASSAIAMYDINNTHQLMTINNKPKGYFLLFFVGGATRILEFLRETSRRSL
jgi:hypothetical protein